MTWIIATQSYLPPRTLSNEDFSFFKSQEELPPMFRGTKLRRRFEKEDQASEIFAKLALHSELELQDIDTILTNVSIPDLVFTGSGAITAKHLGIKPKTVIDFHNGGCISPILLLEHADLLIKAGKAKKVLIGVAQTAGNRVFEQGKNPDRPQACVPGDGAFIWIVSHERPTLKLGASPPTPALAGKVLGFHTECHPEFSEDMKIRFDSGKKYWEAGEQAPHDAGYVDFDPTKMASIGMRGNRLVPKAMKALLQELKLNPSDISALITNQPNPIFLRNWREALQLPLERHFETFETLGNLFQAAIGINLDLSLKAHKIKPGEKILLAGFSHAGDFSGAALLQY